MHAEKCPQKISQSCVHSKKTSARWKMFTQNLSKLHAQQTIKHAGKCSHKISQSCMHNQKSSMQENVHTKSLKAACTTDNQACRKMFTQNLSKLHAQPTIKHAGKCSHKISQSCMHNQKSSMQENVHTKSLKAACTTDNQACRKMFTQNLSKLHAQPKIKHAGKCSHKISQSCMHNQKSSMQGNVHTKSLTAACTTDNQACREMFTPNLSQLHAQPTIKHAGKCSHQISQSCMHNRQSSMQGNVHTKSLKAACTTDNQACREMFTPNLSKLETAQSQYTLCQNSGHMSDDF